MTVPCTRTFSCMSSRQHTMHASALCAAAPLSRPGSCFKVQKAALLSRRSIRTCRQGTQQHVSVRCAAASGSAQAGVALLRSVLQGAASVAAAALLASAPLPAQATEMVSPGEATNMAKALPKQDVAKGKVWLLLAGGSAALFGLTVLLENQGRFFPAISKANEAMAMSKQQRDRLQQGGAADDAIDVEQQPAAEAAPPNIDPVLQGLHSASERVLGPEAAGREEGAKAPPAAAPSNGASPSSSSAASGQVGDGAAHGSTYPAVLGAERDDEAAEHAAHSAGLTAWAGTPGSSGSVAFRQQSDQASDSPVASAPEQPPPPAAAASGAAQLETQAEADLPPQTPPQQADTDAGGLTCLADEELERLIARKQQAVERAAAQQAAPQQQAEEQAAQQQDEMHSKEGSAPLDLSRLTDEDLQRELSKRQLASQVISDIANAD